MLIFQSEYQEWAYAHFEHKHLVEKIRNFKKWILRVKIPLGSDFSASKYLVCFPKKIYTKKVDFIENAWLNKDFIFYRTSQLELFRTPKLVHPWKNAWRI